MTRLLEHVLHSSGEIFAGCPVYPGRPNCCFTREVRSRRLLTAVTPHQSRRIVFVVHSLAAGGAQRVLATMASHWAEQGWHVSLVTLASRDEDFFALHPAIGRVALDQVADSPNLFAAIWSNWRRIRELRRAIRRLQPEIVLSFVDQTNVLALLAARGLSIPVVIAERTDPRHHPLGRIWSWLRRQVYPRATAVVVQTEGVRPVVESLAAGKPVHVIPNGIAKPAVLGQRGDESDRALVAVGRLSHEKGFDLLIMAWSEIAARHPKWRLRIYGDGPARESLERLASEHVSGHVEFCGATCDTDLAYREADLFALPSRYEGFPNALLEAMAHGLPSVAFDCESGPNEIVRDQVDGLLVPPGDVAALALSVGGNGVAQACPR